MPSETIEFLDSNPTIVALSGVTIAGTMEGVERQIRDSPVLRTLGNTVMMSRPDEEAWVLPSGVIAVLLPDGSETRRAHIQDETMLESSSRQRRASGSAVGTHVPKDVMRVVVDPALLSPDEERKLTSYLEFGEIVLHNRRQYWPKARYRILKIINPPRGARIIERHVVYVQDTTNNGDSSE